MGVRGFAVLLLAGGFSAGIVFWGGLHTAVAYSNTERFCLSCHAMRGNVYVEYQQSVHYSNRTGVRASCADCHVPRQWGAMMARKAQASGALWATLAGTLDDPTAFEARRLELARREWRRMLANHSLECRNCHDFSSMEKPMQTPAATRQHLRAVERNLSCIQCHQGVAHRLPDGMTAADQQLR